MMKWYALSVLGLGLFLIFGAANSRGDFMDGSALLQFYALVIGFFCIVGGLIWLAGLLFMGMP